MTAVIGIEPMSATAFRVPKGATLRIRDIAGEQPGDLVAFNAHDPRERFSAARTRVEERTVMVAALDSIVAVSKCSVPIAGRTCSGYEIEIGR